MNNSKNHFPKACISHDDMILDYLKKAKKEKQKLFALLIDPDKTDDEELIDVVKKAVSVGVDMIFVGGSLLIEQRLDSALNTIKTTCDLPIILFPGNMRQINDKADAILFLSLISGRNPDMLIGQHVIAAPHLYRSQLEIIPTGYMLIDGGATTSASYMSNTTPLPRNKSDIAICTALAGEMLGMQMIFADAGSGAPNSIPLPMIKALKTYIKGPLIIGGGIKTPEMAAAIAAAGADVIVIGDIIEKHPEKLEEMVEAIKKGEKL